MKKYLLFFILLVPYIYAQNWGEIRYAQTTTNIRARRTTESKVVGQLTPGQQVKVDFLVNNWYAVFNIEEIARDESRALGYVYATLLKRNPPYNLTKIKWKNMWGKSISQIMEMEENKFIERQSLWGCEFLIYEGYLNGQKCMTSYRFINNKLAQCSYVLTTSYKNHNAYINHYNRFKKVLTNRYREPFASRPNKTMWMTSIIVIKLDLFVRNSTTFLTIVHFDKKQLPTIKKLTPGWGY